MPRGDLVGRSSGLVFRDDRLHDLAGKRVIVGESCWFPRLTGGVPQPIEQCDQFGRSMFLFAVASSQPDWVNREVHVAEVLPGHGDFLVNLDVLGQMQGFRCISEVSGEQEFSDLRKSDNACMTGTGSLLGRLSGA